MRSKSKVACMYYFLAIILFFFLTICNALTIKYSYDDLYRLTRVEHPDGTVIIYNYDNLGNRTSMVVTTPDKKPIVSTGTEVPYQDSADIKGTANPNGLATSTWFEWGTTNNYGNNTSSTSIGSDISSVSVSETITNLQPETTYHYRIVAQNSDGASYGEDNTFTTLSLDQYTLLTTIEGNGSVASTPQGIQCQPICSYSYSDATSVSLQANPANGSKFEKWEFYDKSEMIFDSIANPISTTINSDIHAKAIFFSKATPIATTGSVIPGETSAELTGTMNPNGVETTAWFEWGFTNAYGNATSQQNAGGGTTTIDINASLTGLDPGKTYHYRIAGQNSRGTSYGEDKTFTTYSSSPVYGYDQDNSNSWSKDEAVRVVTDYLVNENVDKNVAVGIVTGYLVEWTVAYTAEWVKTH